MTQEHKFLKNIIYRQTILNDKTALLDVVRPFIVDVPLKSMQMIVHIYYHLKSIIIVIFIYFKPSSFLINYYIDITKMYSTKFF